MQRPNILAGMISLLSLSRQMMRRRGCGSVWWLHDAKKAIALQPAKMRLFLSEHLGVNFEVAVDTRGDWRSRRCSDTLSLGQHETTGRVFTGDLWRARPLESPASQVAPDISCLGVDDTSSATGVCRCRRKKGPCGQHAVGDRSTLKFTRCLKQPRHHPHRSTTRLLSKEEMSLPPRLFSPRNTICFAHPPKLAFFSIRHRPALAYRAPAQRSALVAPEP